jgi:hypothetical protein
VVVALLVYAVATQTLWTRYGVALPQFVPAIHYHIYFRAVQYLFFGLGAVAAVEWVASRYVRERRRAAALALAALVALVVVRLPTYASSQDVAGFRRDALRLAEARGRNALYEWLLANTGPDDVVLASNSLNLYTIGAAGRKVVALDAWYSNPYVSYERRVEDRDAMFACLRSGDAEGFAALASKYGVGYVAVDDAETEPCCRLDAGALGRFREVARFDTVRLYRVPPAGE